MDLKEIKHIWNDSFKDDQHLDKKQIEARLKIKSKSKTALSKIKKSYKFEIITGAAMYFIIIIGLITLANLMTALIFGLIVTLLMGVPYYYGWHTYKKIKNTIIPSRHITHTLTETVKAIEKYVNISKTTFFKYMIIPISILVGMFMGIFVVLEERSFTEVFNSLGNDTIIRMIIIFVVMSGVMIPLSHYFNKKMYKQHLDKLKQCLTELKETEKDNLI